MELAANEKAKNETRQLHNIATFHSCPLKNKGKKINAFFDHCKGRRS
jgi:hypothetical protein